MKLSEKLAPYLENEDIKEIENLENLFLDLMKQKDQWVREYPELKRQADKVPELEDRIEIFQKALKEALRYC